MANSTVYYVEDGTDSVPSSVAATGVVYTYGRKVIGVGTKFTTEFQIYDYLYVVNGDIALLKNGDIGQVINIVSDTEMTLKDPMVLDIYSGYVTAINLTDGGTGYSDDTDVPTTGGTGTGLTVDFTQTLGVIDNISINQVGSGYTAGDVITVTTGNDDATFEITTIGNTSARLTKRFQATSIEIVNKGGGNAIINGETLPNNSSVKFEKQPWGSSRSITDFIEPLALDAVGSDCQITIVK